MDEREARQLAEELAKSLLDHKPMEQVVYNIARVLSYLISEQSGRDQLLQTMKTMSSELWGNAKSAGLIHRIESIERDSSLAKERSEKNAQLIKRSMFGIAAGVTIEALRLLLTHIK